MRWSLGILLLNLLFRVQAGTLGEHSEKIIPFEWRAGLIFILVESPKAKAPLQFVLDSGAGVSVFNLKTAQKLGLPLPRPAFVRGVGSTATGFWPQKFEAKLSDVAMPDKYLTLDLSALSRACNCTVDGLIGVDFFRANVVQIDYRAKAVRILDSFQPSPGERKLSLKAGDQTLLSKVQINGGQPAWLRVDTGCASELEWVEKPCALDSGRKEVAVGLSVIAKGETNVAVTWGNLHFSNVRTGLHATPLFKGEKGLLGNGLLSRFAKVTFDVRHSALYLQP